jgi:hypothetical protein
LNVSFLNLIFIYRTLERERSKKVSIFLFFEGTAYNFAPMKTVGQRPPCKARFIESENEFSCELKAARETRRDMYSSTAAARPQSGPRGPKELKSEDVDGKK